MHFDDPTGAEPTLDLLGSTVQNVPRPRDPQIEAIADPAADANIAFLDALFAKKDTYLEGDRFSSIGDADDFFTKIVGVSFEGRQDRVGGLLSGG